MEKIDDRGADPTEHPEPEMNRKQRRAAEADNRRRRKRLSSIRLLTVEEAFALAARGSS